MKEQEICCVVCPMGCEITVREEGGALSVSGQGCPRGETYAKNEYTAPARTLTTTVKAEGYSTPVIPVRSSKPIPKGRLMECMEVLRRTSVSAPFTIGRPVVTDILGTGADIILTNQ